MSTNAGLLRSAIRWSWVGLAVGVVGTLVFWAWTLGINEDSVPLRIHRGISTNLAVLVLGSLAVQLTARVIVWLRRLEGLQLEMAARLDRMAQTEPLPALRVVASVGARTAADPEDDADRMTGYAKGYADGLARKPIDRKVLPMDRGNHHN